MLECMRTNIEIDDGVLHEAQELIGLARSARPLTWRCVSWSPAIGVSACWICAGESVGRAT